MQLIEKQYYIIYVCIECTSRPLIIANIQVCMYVVDK
jgi:hypothetical protein